jgi:hypothetical protein
MVYKEKEELHGLKENGKVWNPAQGIDFCGEELWI